MEPAFSFASHRAKKSVPGLLRRSRCSWFRCSKAPQLFQRLYYIFIPKAE